MSVKSILILTLLFQVFTLNAQIQLKLDGKSSIEITGTSNIHDWESEVTQFYLSGTAVEKDGKLLKINSLTLTVPVKSIKSGKDLMDTKTYEALLEEKFPNINFVMESAQVLGGKITGKATLTIAGNTKEVNIASPYIQTDASTITVKGSQKVDMELFGVKPPSVLMGSIYTGKDVIIPYYIIINY